MIRVRTAALAIAAGLALAACGQAGDGSVTPSRSATLPALPPSVSSSGLPTPSASVPSRTSGGPSVGLPTASAPTVPARSQTPSVPPSTSTSARPDVECLDSGHARGDCVGDSDPDRDRYDDPDRNPDRRSHDDRHRHSDPVTVGEPHHRERDSDREL